MLAGVPELLKGFDTASVRSIGCGGQMHGLVALNGADHVLRPAILWNDGRTAKEVDYTYAQRQAVWVGSKAGRRKNLYHVFHQ